MKRLRWSVVAVIVLLMVLACSSGGGTADWRTVEPATIGGPGEALEILDEMGDAYQEARSRVMVARTAGEIPDTVWEEIKLAVHRIDVNQHAMADTLRIWRDDGRRGSFDAIFAGIRNDVRRLEDVAGIGGGS